MSKMKINKIVSFKRYWTGEHFTNEKKKEIRKIDTEIE